MYITCIHNYKLNIFLILNNSCSEHDCRQLVKDLRKQLVEVKREKEEQITV